MKTSEQVQEVLERVRSNLNDSRVFYYRMSPSQRTDVDIDGLRMQVDALTECINIIARAVDKLEEEAIQTYLQHLRL